MPPHLPGLGVVGLYFDRCIKTVSILCVQFMSVYAMLCVYFVFIATHYYDYVSRVCVTTANRIVILESTEKNKFHYHAKNNKQWIMIIRETSTSIRVSSSDEILGDKYDK